MGEIVLNISFLIKFRKFYDKFKMNNSSIINILSICYGVKISLKT